MSPLQYCLDKAAPPGSNAYYALFFARPAQKPGLATSLAFTAEVQDIPLTCSDPAVAQTKLQWWREEIVRAYQRRAQHPVAQMIGEQYQRCGWEAEDFQQFIDGTAQELAYDRYPSLRELSHYCHQTGCVSYRLAAQACGYEDSRTAAFSHHLGMGAQLFRGLRRFRDYALRGQSLVPDDVLQAHGVSDDQFSAATTSEALQQAAASHAEQVRQFWREARDALPAADRTRQRPLLAQLRMMELQLDEMAMDGYRLLEHTVDLTPLRKLWHAWRAR